MANDRTDVLFRQSCDGRPGPQGRYESTPNSVKHFRGSWRLRCKQDRVACLGVRDRSWRRTTRAVAFADPASPLGHEQQGPRGPVALGSDGASHIVRGSVPGRWPARRSGWLARPCGWRARLAARTCQIAAPVLLGQNCGGPQARAGAANLHSRTSPGRIWRFRGQETPTYRLVLLGLIFGTNGRRRRPGSTRRSRARHVRRPGPPQEAGPTPPGQPRAQVPTARPGCLPDPRSSRSGRARPLTRSPRGPRRRVPGPARAWSRGSLPGS